MPIPNTMNDMLPRGLGLRDMLQQRYPQMAPGWMGQRVNPIGQPLPSTIPQRITYGTNDDDISGMPVDMAGIGQRLAAENSRLANRANQFTLSRNRMAGVPTMGRAASAAMGSPPIPLPGAVANTGGPPSYLRVPPRVPAQPMNAPQSWVNRALQSPQVMGRFMEAERNSSFTPDMMRALGALQNRQTRAQATGAPVGNFGRRGILSGG